MQTCAVAKRLNLVSVAQNTRCILPSVGLAALPRPAARRVPAPVPALPGTSNISVPGDKADLPGYLATAGLLATHLTTRVSFTPELLYTSLAVYQLVHVVLSVIDGKVSGGGFAPSQPPARDCDISRTFLGLRRPPRTRSPTWWPPHSWPPPPWASSMPTSQPCRPPPSRLHTSWRRRSR
jgi:hypothetical protein